MRITALTMVIITLSVRGQARDAGAAINLLARTEIETLGLSGAVVDGRFVSVRAYGTANIATGERLTPKHLFRIGP